MLGPNSNLQFGQAQMLSSVVNTKQNLETSFWFNSSGELVGVAFPYGGNLQWSYQNATYQTNRTHREVYQRFLQMSNGATQYTYTVAHDAGCTPTVVHCSTTVQDVTGNGKKAWAFETNSAAIGFGLQKAFEDHDLTSGDVPKTHSDFTWALDDSTTYKRPYISSTLTQLDPGTSSQVQKRSDQVVDIYGNVTSMSPYDFGSPNAPGTPTRTYALQQRHGAQYRPHRLNATAQQLLQFSLILLRDLNTQCGAGHTLSMRQNISKWNCLIRIFSGGHRTSPNLGMA